MGWVQRPHPDALRFTFASLEVSLAFCFVKLRKWESANSVMKNISINSIYCICKRLRCFPINLNTECYQAIVTVATYQASNNGDHVRIKTTEDVSFLSVL